MPTKSKPNLYQQAYHFLARNTGGAAGRRKAMRKIHSSASPAFSDACDQVIRNNPHFMREKNDPEYNRLRDWSYNHKKGRRSR